MTALVHYDTARKALQAAVTTDEVKHISDKAEAMRVYAQQAKDKQLEIDAAEIRFRAERRLGELLKAQKETVGLNPGTRSQKLTRVSGGAVAEPPENKLPTLADAGIDKKLSARAQKIADIPEEKFEQRLADRRANEIASVGDSFLEEKPHVSHNSGENEWYTPSEFIHAARRVMGTIDLDPASTEKANEVVNAETIYTIEQDGLSKRWTGNVFLNPPYSSDLVGRFCEKLALHYKRSEVKAAVVLVNNATETAWFQALAKSATAICFPARRISYWTPTRESKQPLQGQAFLYFGASPKLFDAAFSSFGFIVEIAK